MDLLVSGNAVGKHVERLLPRHACAAFDLPRHPGVGGHHRQRVVRPAALAQPAHSLRGRGIKKTQAIGPLADFLNFLSSFAQGATCTGFSTQFLTVPVPIATEFSYGASPVRYRIFLDRFS